MAHTYTHPFTPWETILLKRCHVKMLLIWENTNICQEITCTMEINLLCVDGSKSTGNLLSEENLYVLLPALSGPSLCQLLFLVVQGTNRSSKIFRRLNISSAKFLRGFIFVAMTTRQYNLLHLYIEENFVGLIFILEGDWRKIFCNENFLIYGMLAHQLYTLLPHSTLPSN